MNPKEGSILLDNGSTLFWRTTCVGSREYVSDEIACGLPIWDTALVSKESLITAIDLEDQFEKLDK